MGWQRLLFTVLDSDCGLPYSENFLLARAAGLSGERWLAEEGV